MVYKGNYHNKLIIIYLKFNEMATTKAACTTDACKQKELVEGLKAIAVAAAKAQGGKVAGNLCPPTAGVTCATGLCCGMATYPMFEKIALEVIYGESINEFLVLGSTCEKKDTTELVDKTDNTKSAWACCTGGICTGAKALVVSAVTALSISSMM